MCHGRATSSPSPPGSQVAWVLAESQVVSRNHRTDFVRDGQRPATWGRVRSDFSKGWRNLHHTNAMVHHGAACAETISTRYRSAPLNSTLRNRSGHSRGLAMNVPTVTATKYNYRLLVFII